MSWWAPMGTPDRADLRLLAFSGGLVLALVAGFGIGRWAGPTDGTTGGSNMSGAMPGASHPGDGHNHGDGGGTIVTDTAVGGLAVSAGGYTLVPETTSFAAGASQPLRFRITGPDRNPVKTFAPLHDKQLHLVVIRRDLTGYQHLHPTMAADGTWQVDITLPQPGIWRAYADFAALDAQGQQHPTTLGVDLTVAGGYQPVPLPPPVRESTVDGLTVTVEGTPQLRATNPLLFRVFSSGTPVTNLQRYLGAYGHLVVLREGDLGYVHVHAEEQLIGGAVKFWLAAPSSGRYRMFFDFQLDGRVHTAQYTMLVA